MAVFSQICLYEFPVEVLEYSALSETAYIVIKFEHRFIKKQRVTPITVGMIAANAVHLALLVSLFIVMQVVEQGK